MAKCIASPNSLRREIESDDLYALIRSALRDVAELAQRGVAMKRTTIIIGAAVGAIVVLGLAAGIVAYRTSSDTLVILPWRCDDGAGGDQ
jgi:hypothetical protein